jgi:hypothetical protein
MNDTSNHVNGFLKKMCIRDGTLDFIDIHIEFSKQGTVIKPLCDTNDVSGVHISSSGEEKLCEIFSKYLTALPGKGEFPVTPQHDKQELSLKKRCTTKHKYVILLRTVFH